MDRRGDNRRAGPSSGRRAPNPRDELPAEARRWGNVARRGAQSLRREHAEEQPRRERERERQGAAPEPLEEWVRVDEPQAVRSAAGAPTRPASPRPTLPAEVATEIRNSAIGSSAHRKERLVERMSDAVAAFERNRFQEAVRLGRHVASEVPSVAAVRELVGLAAYRNGQWTEARRQLEAYRDLTGAADHVPELMDSLRALGKAKRVAELWTELRRQSPEADVLAEARIVAAATLADRGDLNGAITLLTSGGAAKPLRNPSSRHIRQWYVLADLYERAGDLPRAVELFNRIHQHDREAYDVADRLAALGGSRRRPRRPPRATSGKKVVPD